MDNLVKFWLAVTISILQLLQGSQVNCDIGADAMSTARIVEKLCAMPISEDFARQFYGCYNTVDQSERCIFDRCQQQVVGYSFNSSENLEDLCKNRLSMLTPYFTCVIDGYKNCGKGMQDALAAGTRINICMADLLGIK